MKKFSPEGKIEKPESKFEALFNEDSKKIIFAGDKAKIVDFLVRVHFYPQFDETQIDKWQFEQEKSRAHGYFLEHDQRRDKTKQSIELTPLPFRLYVYPEPGESFGSTPHGMREEQLQKLGIGEKPDRVLVLMMRNGYSMDRKEEEKQWKEVKKAFGDLQNKVFSVYKNKAE